MWFRNVNWMLQFWRMFAKFINYVNCAILKIYWFNFFSLWNDLLHTIERSICLNGISQERRKCWKMFEENEGFCKFCEKD